jgi:hypothetical protein
MQCKSVSAAVFLVCTWPDISPPQNRCTMPVPTRTLRSSYARFELAMGTFCALSWKVHPPTLRVSVQCASPRYTSPPVIDTSFSGSEGNKEEADTTSVLAAIKAQPDFLSSLIWPWIGHPARFAQGIPDCGSKSRPVLGGSYFFRENHWFRFLGAYFKNRLDSFFFFNSHFENHPGFQNSKKNPIRRFSGLAVLTEFLNVDFQIWFSEIMIFLYIYRYMYTFFRFFFFYYNHKWKL